MVYSSTFSTLVLERWFCLNVHQLWCYMNVCLVSPLDGVSETSNHDKIPPSELSVSEFDETDSSKSGCSRPSCQAVVMSS